MNCDCAKGEIFLLPGPMDGSRRDIVPAMVRRSRVKITLFTRLANLVAWMPDGSL